MQLIQQQPTGVKSQLVRYPIFKRKYIPEHINAGFLETLVSDITYWPILPKVSLPPKLKNSTASAAFLDEPKFTFEKKYLT